MINNIIDFVAFVFTIIVMGLTYILWGVAGVAALGAIAFLYNCYIKRKTGAWWR